MAMNKQTLSTTIRKINETMQEIHDQMQTLNGQHDLLNKNERPDFVVLEEQSKKLYTLTQRYHGQMCRMTRLMKMGFQKEGQALQKKTTVVLSNREATPWAME